MSVALARHDAQGIRHAEREIGRRAVDTDVELLARASLHVHAVSVAALLEQSEVCVVEGKRNVLATRHGVDREHRVATPPPGGTIVAQWQQ